MRIISGKNKGKRLIAPAKLPSRPTTDMAKESLFNILNNDFYFEEISVLDLFSGTGNISYEFASRGSKHIISVDSSADCIRFIEKTSKELNFGIQAVKQDCISFLQRNNLKYDVIFADPPYEIDPLTFETLTHLVFERNLLHEGGMLIIEHSSHTDLSSLPHFQYFKKYGGTIFSFFYIEDDFEEENDELS